MCTALGLKVRDFYFGRNLDLEYQFGEEVLVTPRHYPWQWREVSEADLASCPFVPGHEKYALIGMGNVSENYPLYAEACNEHGLAMAGLNFPGNALYAEAQEGKLNVTPFEFIPFILSQCQTVSEARKLLTHFNLLAEAFNEKMPLAPLHFIIADQDDCIVVEQTREGLKVYENPYYVLTNNPPFPFHEANLQLYSHLSRTNYAEGLGPGFKVQPFGQGLGAFGLPGDASPSSRFVKTAFHRFNSDCAEDELSAVSQFFHILDSVSFVRGSVVTSEGLNDITTYNCCMNCHTGDYYFKTYDNHQISCVSLRRTDLDSSELSRFKLPREEAIKYLN